MSLPYYLKPLEKANLHNEAVVAATDILATAISPSYTVGVDACEGVLFRIMVAMDVAGVFSAQITNTAVTVEVNFNGGNNLVVDAVYMFDMLVHSGDTVNFRHSMAGNALILRVQEIATAVQ